ncbi:MAG: DNA topoisomerase VI subunit B [Candidatus Jordarchaeales archaeon]|nr:DNA topoisomerase VI subunit B [Candidatus Jordarchaeia archaeon]
MCAAVEVKFEAISPADFFYRNRDIAGFDNPMRAIYTAIRELVENSLDACEDGGILPEILIAVEEAGENTFKIMVMDNGIGVPRDNIQSCFGQILYGSKYTHRQARGRFGLGGKMAFLYGQITTHKPLHVTSAPIGDEWVYDVTLRMDIQNNRPELLEWTRRKGKKGWHGLVVEFYIEGDWIRARRYILEYVKQTALITPYATITFIDPDGVLYFFPRSVEKMPPPPTEVLPHPRGVDVEQVRRIISETKTRDMVSFLRTHFHRVGKKTAEKFLDEIGISRDKDPRELKPDEIVTLVRKMKTYKEFLPPDAKCLSPLGEELLEAGIRKELNPDFVKVVQRPPSSYGGHPFIVEVGIAYGGGVPRSEEIILYRFANKIPLLFDEYKDVSAKVIRSIKWSRYRIKPGMPIAIFVHLVSTNIPFKTAGKEFIADRPELEVEIRRGILECARALMRYIQRKERVAREKQRLSIYEKFLPLIVRDITILAGEEKEPDYTVLLEKYKMITEEEIAGGEGAMEEEFEEGEVVPSLEELEEEGVAVEMDLTVEGEDAAEEVTEERFVEGETVPELETHLEQYGVPEDSEIPLTDNPGSALEVKPAEASHKKVVRKKAEKEKVKEEGSSSSKAKRSSSKSGGRAKPARKSDKKKESEAKE